MMASNEFFRLNVGFIVHESVGYSRDFPLVSDLIRLPDLNLQNLAGSARVTRAAQGLLVQVRLDADVDAECGRCLEPFVQHLSIDFTDLYAFSTVALTDSILRMPENGKIDLAPIIREEMLLAMPMNALCQVDCKGLCPVCGENQNLTTCQHDDEEVDPRLSSLRALL